MGLERGTTLARSSGMTSGRLRMGRGTAPRRMKSTVVGMRMILMSCSLKELKSVIKIFVDYYDLALSVNFAIRWLRLPPHVDSPRVFLGDDMPM